MKNGGNACDGCGWLADSLGGVGGPRGRCGNRGAELSVAFLSESAECNDSKSNGSPSVPLDGWDGCSGGVVLGETLLSVAGDTRDTFSDEL